MKARDVIYKAIKKHWDHEAIEAEVTAILKALKKKGFSIINEN